jgi:ribosomal protein S21
MVQVTRKDEREDSANIIRRFNRKVLQSGILAEAKASMRFAKPLSKRERRVKAIIRKERKADKLNKARLGLR